MISPGRNLVSVTSILVLSTALALLGSHDRSLSVERALAVPVSPPFTQAEWIAPPVGGGAGGAGGALPLFRKEFKLNTELSKATLRIVGLGDYDASVNGRRLASTGINQAWSQHEKTIYYRGRKGSPRMLCCPQARSSLFGRAFRRSGSLGNRIGSIEHQGIARNGLGRSRRVVCDAHPRPSVS